MVIRKMGFLCMLVLLSGTNVASAPPVSFELQSILTETDCADVLNRRAFSLNVLGFSFSVSKGYEFFGFEHGAAAFRTHPEIHPADKLDQYPDRAAVALALKRYAASSASIMYYPAREDAAKSKKGLEGFEFVEWRGLDLYFGATVGGQVSKDDTIYYVTLRAEGYDEELVISAGAPELIADIVACAEDT